MSTFRGTPGLWHLSDAHGPVVVQRDDHTLAVAAVDASVWGGFPPDAECYANGVLIAQTPRMLEVLTALTDADAPYAARVDLAMILSREILDAIRSGGAL